MGNTALPATLDTSPVVWLPPLVAAQMCGYPRHRLVRMGDAGELTVRREGRDRRFRLDEIEALAAGCAA